MNKKHLSKSICICACCFLSCVATFAQSAFAKGDKVINLGVGLPTYLGGSGYSMSMPLISGSFEYGIVDNLIDGKASVGVGGYVGYTANKYTYKYLDNFGYKYSYFIIGPRGAFHYSPIPALDAYGGGMFGYTVIGSSSFGTFHESDTKYNVNDSNISYSVFVGARYYFADGISAFTELGYGIAPIEIGISFKF